MNRNNLPQNLDGDYAKFFECIPVGITLCTLEGTIVDANSRFCQLLGYAKDELMKRNAHDFYVDPAERQALHERLRRSGYVSDHESLLKRKDGTSIPTNLNMALLTLHGKRLLLTATQDLSARVQTEERMREKEAQYRAIFNSATDAFVVFDLDGKVVDANPRACTMYGYSYAELTALSGKDLVQPHYQHLFRQCLEDIRRDGEFSAESEDRKKDGTPFAIEVHGTAFEYKGKKHVLGILRDVTKRKQAELELRNSLAEIKKLKDRLHEENIYLQEEVNLAFKHENIIGQSDALRKVLSQVEKVAGTDSTVLLIGETGTGKELIARAIHSLSSRSARPLVKVNCPALPSSLIESELFGHERGAYTGALSRQIGRFELADGSTIFLDEISELQLDLQAKLLRVLQEGQFERLGSTRTIQTNVRVIAATNQDLSRAVQEGRFRADLYYRLNVFPIVLPPLRDRREDIPLLVRAFVSEMGRSMGKKIETITRKSIDDLQSYDWPGNVRELRSVVEQALILSKGPTLNISLPRTKAPTAKKPATLNEVEREHILEVLRRTGWHVRGPRGAAEILGLKPTTLEARMKKLGIKRP